MSAEEESKTHTINHPYLTDAGRITSGSRLESFLADVGRYEDPFYENKKLSMSEDNERMRKADKKAGRESLIPSDEILEQVEQADHPDAVSGLQAAIVDHQGPEEFMWRATDINNQETEDCG